MFVNKINSVQNIGFKGYQHIKNDVGETVMRFNYPYDSDKETCEIQIFSATPTEKYDYKLSSSPIATINLKPEGVDVNLQEITNLDKDAPFAYQVVKKDKATGKVLWQGADTGVKVKSKDGIYVNRVQVHDVGLVDTKDGGKTLDYTGDPISNYTHTIVSRKGTTPIVQGAGYLITPDSLMPGAMYRGFTEENTGEIYYDKDFQNKMEGVIKNFSNIYGGSIAGAQKAIPYLKENGYKYMFSTPIANGSKGWSLGYWNKNNMQVSPNMGNTENFASFFRDLYTNGMKYVYDGTFTSEGLEGIHFQYALRWAEKTPQSYYWFRMSGLKNSNLGLGAIPKNKENLRYRVVNAPYNYELQGNGTYKKVVNPDYNSRKETMFQIYDASQASDKQIKALDKAIINYEKLTEGKALDINNHDETVINFIFQIDPKEYDRRIDVINELNKKYGKNIKLDSADGTIMAAQFSNFKIDKKTEGGFVTWDANTDMVKMNYGISGYDEKLLQAIVSRSERDYEKQMIERGAREVQDLTIQSGIYWTGKVKDIQTIYTAQTVGKAKTVEDINKLIKDGKLPEEAKLNNEALSNILNGQYLLSPKGVLVKDDVTVKSLMKLPLDTLEFGENTVGVLSTSYFSNRATTDETVGVSRFDLMKQNNPHLVEPYAKNYKRVNSLFNNEIKDFADAIIKKVNSTSNEKLLDSNGDYTEYGEYVMELVGQDITKYAFLKSLGGDSFKTKILPNGEITYDYEALKEGTSLKALDINGNSPEDEAEKLENKIEKGIRRLSDSDIAYVAESISKRISGTDTSSFRIAEALVDRTGLGLDWRLDACKDVMDMDAIRNEDNSFDDNWDAALKFWTKFVQAIKQENPNSYIVAEITDIELLLKDNYGEQSYPYNNNTNVGQKFNGEPDAFVKFFNETGITSEAAYSYFFTDLLTNFAPAFDDGTIGNSENHDRFKARFDLLMQTRSVDYLRNLYTFMGNHDKPRMIHGLAVDMSMFHANILGADDRGHKTREAAIQVLSGAKTVAEVPIELRLNVDNNDYFLTTSARAVATSKLLMDVINEEKSISEEDKKRLIDALIDLTNGNYLGEGVTDSMQKIKIKELSSLEAAFNAILGIAKDINLSEADRKKLVNAVIEKANSKDLKDYLVHGELDWKDTELNEKNYKYAEEILGTKPVYDSYSLYTIQLARLLKDAYKETKLYPNLESSINEALKVFAETYNRHAVETSRGEFKRIEDPVTGMKKNGYAARDLKVSLTMAVKQAEFKSGKPIENKQTIIDAAYKSATEAAVVKASMIMEFLKGLPGIPTMYSGDELGMTGYEEKAKNVYLQNRNALPWTETEGESDIAKYRRTVMSTMNGALKDRSNPELAPLNNGTPYALEVKAHNFTRSEATARLGEIGSKINEINEQLKSKTADKALSAELKKLEDERSLLSKDFAKIAYMMHSANGDMTVTLFNAGDVDFSNRCNYFEKYGLDTEEKRKKFFEENNIETINPDNKYIPILPKSEVDAIMLGAGIAIPVGTVFTNANARDKAEYVVKEIGGKLGIVKKDGGKIVMDGKTAKNGVMILKHIKKVIFKGAPKKKVYYNKQYNFASNPYKQPEQTIEGEKLSILAK